MVVILGEQYNNGEKPTVMLYTYIIKDSVAIAIRSLKDRFVTIVSLTLVLI